MSSTDDNESLSDSPVEGDIPQDEQWRIVNESGILDKIQQSDAQPAPASPTPLADEILNAVMLLIPFSTLYIVMDILCLQQYRQKPTFKGEVDRMTEAVPVLTLLIFYTNRHKARRLVQAGLTIAGIASSMRLFWIVNHGSWTVVMRQAPPLSTIWIYSIVQLQLFPAVLNLVVTALYVKWKGLRVTF